MGETLIPWVKERLSFILCCTRSSPERTATKDSTQTFIRATQSQVARVALFTIEITAWFVGVSLLKTSCLVPTSLSSCFESLSIMEEHGLTDAERQLFLGLLNDPEAEAGGGTNWRQRIGIRHKDPAQHVQIPDCEENSDVGQVEDAEHGGDACHPRERQEIEDVVAMPAVRKMGPSTLRFRFAPGIVVRDNFLQSFLELYTQSIAEGPPKPVSFHTFGRSRGHWLLPRNGNNTIQYKFKIVLSTEELQEESPGYFQLDPQYCPVLVQTERTNLDFDTAIQGIEASTKRMKRTFWNTTPQATYPGDTRKHPRDHLLGSGEAT